MTRSKTFNRTHKTDNVQANSLNPKIAKSIRRPRPTFHRHAKCHKTVIRNPFWYGDEGPPLGNSFSAAQTKRRQDKVLAILQRAAKSKKRRGLHKKSKALMKLAKKIKRCRPKRRCGSQACPLCARAFQRAKVAAQTQLTADLEQDMLGKTLVMVTAIPLEKALRQGKLKKLNVSKANRWLKDKLGAHGIKRLIVGAADLSWEKQNGKGYWQLHWHLAMWTKKPKALTQKLKDLFPSVEKYDRPVEVTKTVNRDFLAYMHKAIKLPELLRHNRKNIPELLLFLDRTEPLDFLVLQGVRMSAQQDGLVFHRIEEK
jgi:hypothetical protein